MNPEDVINLMKLEKQENEHDNSFGKEFIEERKKKSKNGRFIVFHSLNNTCIRKYERTISELYKQNCGISKDFKLIALIRESAERKETERTSIIDIFKVKDINFFERKELL